MKMFCRILIHMHICTAKHWQHWNQLRSTLQQITRCRYQSFATNKRHRCRRPRMQLMLNQISDHLPATVKFLDNFQTFCSRPTKAVVTRDIFNSLINMHASCYWTLA